MGEHIQLTFLTLALDIGEWLASHPCHIILSGDPGTHRKGGWVGLRAILNTVGKGKLLSLMGIEPQPSSP
jgi:hypothetical protein